MSTPKVTEVVGGYTFGFEAEGISIKVSRLRLHTSDSRVTGELQFLSAAGKPIFPQTSLNFTAERSRTALAKSLTELDSSLPWGDIMNSVSIRVITMARAGEPVRELDTALDVPPPEWLLEPLLYKGLPTIIFGEKAVCKSTLSLCIYTCLALPWTDNPLGWVAPTRKVKTLLCDYEVDYDVAHYNIKQLQIGMELPSFSLYYRRCSIPLADDVEQLQAHIEKLGAEAIIVDSLGPAVGGDLKDPGTALRFTSAIRQLKCSALIIGQTSKDTKSKTKSVFGSTFFEYYARNIVEIRKAQEEGEDSLDIALYNTYHNLGKRFRPMGYHLNFNGTGTHIESQPITAPELIDRIGTQARILKLLQTESPLNIAKIAEGLDLKEGNIRVVLGTLRNRGLVIRLGDKKSGITYARIVKDIVKTPSPDMENEG